MYMLQVKRDMHCTSSSKVLWYSFLFKATGKRTRTPLVLAETPNAGLLHDAVKQKIDLSISIVHYLNRYFVQSVSG